MYKIVPSKRFKKDLRKLARSGAFDLENFNYVVDLLASDKALPLKYKDHQLVGKLGSFRECHLSPDLLLIYSKFDDLMVLSLMRLGSHSELF